MAGCALLPLILAEGAAAVKTGTDRFEHLVAQAAGHLGSGVRKKGLQFQSRLDHVTQRPTGRRPGPLVRPGDIEALCPNWIRFDITDDS